LLRFKNLQKECYTNLFCQDEDENTPWAIILFIRIDDQIHAVLFPSLRNTKKVAKFEKFIQNPQKRILVRNAIFKNGSWYVYKRKKELHWREGID